MNKPTSPEVRDERQEK